MSDFIARHIGPNAHEIHQLLRALGVASLEEFERRVIPETIRGAFDLARLDLPAGQDEAQALAELRALASRNQVYRSYIGQGYYGTRTPGVILRNILENPAWYTQYTPYQAEIAQGRLEALLNFQQLVMDLTQLPVANASLLDEATAAAEAVGMAFAITGRSTERPLLVSDRCHVQNIAVIQTRAEPLGMRVEVVDLSSVNVAALKPWAVVVQTPDTQGGLQAWRTLAEQTHAQGGLVIAITDLLALTLYEPPGAWGADIAVGSAQRLGVPMGFGGPHAAFLSTREEHKRLIPGRIVGVSTDAEGRPAYRLALQTREQHIRRDKATSNICTAQVLLAVMASMYAVYHGAEGLRAIASAIRRRTVALGLGLERLGYGGVLGNSRAVFDTLAFGVDARLATEIEHAADRRRINLRIARVVRSSSQSIEVGVSLDETTTDHDVAELLEIFAAARGASTLAKRSPGTDAGVASSAPPSAPRADARLDATLLAEADAWLAQARDGGLGRTSAYLTHPVFSRYQTESEMLRYITRLQSRDLSLAHSMIPLGSCTMKLNATTEMMPVSWPEFSALHPFAPAAQTQGYLEMFSRLERWISAITGFDAVSLQPNAGSQGEYAGLLVIRAYHRARGESHRNVCLIPQSAHGTNPASAVMAGMRVVVVRCDEQGNVDLADLKRQAEAHSRDLAALMVTYPSTHGVFEDSIQKICSLIHQHGGQVYLDGANLNAQVALCRPGDYGADVCHLNLHKTFCIPHGGGGPGMGPIGVKRHLAPYLPSHPMVRIPGTDAQAIGPVSGAPWGSASILPISYAYISMMGAQGLRQASLIALLSANYMAKRLADHYPVVYRGPGGWIAHEAIIDLRALKQEAGIEVEDVAKRLMDYGFHAPTVSWPVAGTMMIEPTESETLAELDRYCDALIAIRHEVRKIEQGQWDRSNNPLKRAPHTLGSITAPEWNRPYTRAEAVTPGPWQREFKFWPAVARIDAVAGDRNLVCACPPIEDYGT